LRNYGKGIGKSREDREGNGRENEWREMKGGED